MPITEQERQERMRAFQAAEAINAIGGVPISDYARQLFHRWIDGEIGMDELEAAMHEYHLRVAAECGSQGTSLGASARTETAGSAPCPKMEQEQPIEPMEHVMPGLKLSPMPIAKFTDEELESMSHAIDPDEDIVIGHPFDENDPSLHMTQDMRAMFFTPEEQRFETFRLQK